MSSRYYIPILEFDITNRCNLNCARCSHFSPLASFNCMDYSLEQFTNDVQEIKKKFPAKQEIVLRTLKIRLDFMAKSVKELLTSHP